MNTRWIGIAVAVVVSGLALAQNPPPPQEPAEIAKESGCFECHSVSRAVVGPAWRDVAARYKNNERSRERLIATVSKGGKGNWTRVTRGVPMPPHDRRLTREQIARLVDWILTLDSPNR